MKLGYLGPIGSFSYEAAQAYSKNAELVPMQNFYEIIQKVEMGVIETGILPIENSTEGAVTPVMDGLLKTKKALITNELVLSISHNLVSLNKNIEEIENIFSHQQAIEQCRDYFRKHLPNARLIACESSSLACTKAKELGKGAAAITNKEAGSIYGRNLLTANIHDNSFNQTRFVIISQQSAANCFPCKTSIAFAFLNDRPGSLYKALKEFADKDINLTRIESRPAKAEIGKYIFYIDFIGNPQEGSAKEALDKIKNMAGFLKVFGTYPTAE